VFSGQYWDFRIWNGALTGGQVANAYAAGPSVIAGPKLLVSPAGGSHIAVSWPANATTFGLFSTTNLAHGTWAAVPGTPGVTNGLNTMIFSAPPAQSYYRLKE
jgi:hypothetical protein